MEPLSLSPITPLHLSPSNEFACESSFGVVAVQPGHRHGRRCPLSLSHPRVRVPELEQQQGPITGAHALHRSSNDQRLVCTADLWLTRAMRAIRLSVLPTLANHASAASSVGNAAPYRPTCLYLMRKRARKFSHSAHTRQVTVAVACWFSVPGKVPSLCRSKMRRVRSRFKGGTLRSSGYHCSVARQ